MKQLLTGLLLVLAAVFLVVAVSPLGGQTMRQLGVPSTPAITGGDANDVIYTTDGLTLSGSDSFEFSGSQLKLANNVGLAFHSSAQAAFLYNTDQTHDDLQLGINVNGTSGGAGYFSLMQKADLQHANRAASAPSPDPVFRIYSSDQAQAGDYLEFTHNQTNAVLNVGTGSAGGFSVITGGTAALSIDSSQNVILDAGTLSFDASQAFGIGTGIIWGDGDSALYESSDDNIYLSLGGAIEWQFMQSSMGGWTTGNPWLMSSVSSATVPTLVPHNGSPTTGIGGVSGTLSLITGGTAGLTVDASQVVSLPGNIGANPPSTCTAGTFWIDTDETSDTNCTTTNDNSLCLCVATDTWVALDNHSH